MQRELDEIEAKRQELKRLQAKNAAAAQVQRCLLNCNGGRLRTLLLHRFLVQCCSLSHPTCIRTQVVCAGAHGEVLPVRSTQPLTQPEEFYFATLTRARKHGDAADQQPSIRPKTTQNRVRFACCAVCVLRRSSSSSVWCCLVIAEAIELCAAWADQSDAL